MTTSNNLVVSDELTVSPSEVFIGGVGYTEQDLNDQCDEIVSELHVTNNPAKLV